jgi:monoamine oxidase
MLTLLFSLLGVIYHYMFAMEKHYCVVIIGAGIAGLSCAKYFIENDIIDFVIIEANDQIGGRCQTIPFCKDFLR